MRVIPSPAVSFPAPDPSLAAALLRGAGDQAGLFAEARRLRDEGKGRVVTYSRKVFLPITTLCRDRCAYCTFAAPPGAGGRYLETEEALAVARAGEALACTEALLTLGDRPEDRWPVAREFLAGHGCASTLEYTARVARAVAEQTTLFPHANPGIMDGAAVAALRPWCASMGLMLESISPRLLEPGMPHYGCPDKDPALRMATLRALAAQRVPLTTGVLVGLGETAEESADGLFALAALAAETNAVQEVIVQNFRAKPGTPMRAAAEPTPQHLARVVAVARWVLGPEMNLQVPPNLSDRFEAYLDAGVNDWGGVSPLTPDWVNPEAPWPHLDELRARTAAAGFRLMPRLPVYPEFLRPEWADPAMYPRLRAAADEQGYARAPQREAAL
jgi:FO synthase